MYSLLRGLLGQRPLSPPLLLADRVAGVTTDDKILQEVIAGASVDTQLLEKACEWAVKIEDTLLHAQLQICNCILALLKTHCEVGVRLHSLQTEPKLAGRKATKEDCNLMKEYEARSTVVRLPLMVEPF